MKTAEQGNLLTIPGSCIEGVLVQFRVIFAIFLIAVVAVATLSIFLVLIQL